MSDEFKRDELSCRCDLCKKEFKDKDDPCFVYKDMSDDEVDLNTLCYFNLFPNPKRTYFLQDIRNLTPSDAVIVEVGSHVGFVSNLFASQNRTVYCIDVWDDYYYNDNDGGEGGIISHNRFLGGWQRVFSRFCHNAGPRLFKQIIPIRAPSKVVAKNWNQKVDLVYIDGAHDFESVRSDILSWLPFVKEGGYMGGDDFDSVSVRSAVLSCFNGYQPPTEYDLSGQWVLRCRNNDLEPPV